MWFWRHDPEHCGTGRPRRESRWCRLRAKLHRLGHPRSRRRINEESIKNASFFVADVQCDDLGGPYDHRVLALRHHVFYLPGLALRNIRRALVPGGELTMFAWRRREDNPWMHEAKLRVRKIVPVVA